MRRDRLSEAITIKVKSNWTWILTAKEWRFGRLLVAGVTQWCYTSVHLNVQKPFEAERIALLCLYGHSAVSCCKRRWIRAHSQTLWLWVYCHCRRCACFLYDAGGQMLSKVDIGPEFLLYTRDCRGWCSTRQRSWCGAVAREIWRTIADGGIVLWRYLVALAAGGMQLCLDQCLQKFRRSAWRNGNFQGRKFAVVWDLISCNEGSSDRLLQGSVNEANKLFQKIEGRVAIRRLTAVVFKWLRYSLWCRLLWDCQLTLRTTW